MTFAYNSFADNASSRRDQNFANTPWQGLISCKYVCLHLEAGYFDHQSLQKFHQICLNLLLQVPILSDCNSVSILFHFHLIFSLSLKIQARTKPTNFSSSDWDQEPKDQKVMHFYPHIELFVSEALFFGLKGWEVTKQSVTVANYRQPATPTTKCGVT